MNCEIKLETDPCRPDICKSGSTCTPRLNGGFVCEDCSPAVGIEHYTPLCELRTRSFVSNSFLTFPGLKQRHRLHLQLKCVIRYCTYVFCFNCFCLDSQLALATAYYYTMAATMNSTTLSPWKLWKQHYNFHFLWVVV